MNLDAILADEIKYLIIERKLQEGDFLPSERELCNLFKVQRLTIRSSLNFLKIQGIISVKSKSGYIVCKSRIVRNTKSISSMTDVFESMSVNSLTKVLEFEMFEVNKSFVNLLKAPLGTKMYHFTRLRILNDEPIEYDITYMPVSLFPDLSLELLENHSLYHVIKERYGVILAQSYQTVDVIDATSKIQKLLSIPDNTKIILQHGNVLNQDNELIEYTESYMKPERFVYES